MPSVLVAPCCAIPRDYLTDTLLACALWGFWCLNMANWLRYPPPFSERFPLGEHAKWRCDTPPHNRGISAILARYYMKTRQNACDTPLLPREFIPKHKIAEMKSTTLFGDHPFSIKQPQDNFGLQNVNWHPPKCKLTPSKKGLATSNLQFLY